MGTGVRSWWGAQRRREPKHLLWTLMFLKLYMVENVCSTLSQVDEKTYRKSRTKVIEDLDTTCSEVVSGIVVVVGVISKWYLAMY